MTFSVGTSSVNKGESVRDTIETIEAMGIDAIVVRHRNAGVPHQVAAWSAASVINAGDGAHEHPTQALLDATDEEHALVHRQALVGAGRGQGVVGGLRHGWVFGPLDPVHRRPAVAGRSVATM
jgi:aspartate carbamoyltransferase catalytic subunit